MIMLRVEGKRFGKNFINYEAKDNETLEVIVTGRCRNYETISRIYQDMLATHGEGNVLMLNR